MIHASHIPLKVFLPPALLVRALRSALRMSQAQLSRRCGVPRAHIARLESGTINFQWSTIERLCDAMFCDLLILPRPRKRLGDAIAERDLEKPFGCKTWD